MNLVGYHSNGHSIDRTTSANSLAIDLLWVTNIAGHPLFFNKSLTSFANFSDKSSSKELNGSSSSSTDGFANSARARATL